MVEKETILISFTGNVRVKRAILKLIEELGAEGEDLGLKDLYDKQQRANGTLESVDIRAVKLGLLGIVIIGTLIIGGLCLITAPYQKMEEIPYEKIEKVN